MPLVYPAFPCETCAVPVFPDTWNCLAYRGTEDAAQRISDLEREIKQREQSIEYSIIKERLEDGRQSIADRERKAAKRKRHDRGLSR